MIQEVIRTTPDKALTETADISNIGDVIKASAGDTQAFERLMLANKKKLEHQVSGMVSNPEDRQDLISEIFTKAWRKIKTLRDPGTFDAWLNSIAKTHVSYFLTRKQSRAAILERPGREPIIQNHPLSQIRWPSNIRLPDFAQLEEVKEVCRVWEEALRKLTPDQRQILYLKIDQEKSHTEIAGLAKINYGTSRSRLHYAVKAMHIALTQSSGILKELMENFPLDFARLMKACSLYERELKVKAHRHKPRALKVC